MKTVVGKLTMSSLGFSQLCLLQKHLSMTLDPYINCRLKSMQWVVHCTELYKDFLSFLKFWRPGLGGKRRKLRKFVNGGKAA